MPQNKIFKYLSFCYIYMKDKIFELDTKDRKILEQLELNARQSSSQIAKKVGLSKDAVLYRIKNLEERKIILGYHSVLNLSKLGFLSYKIMLSFRDIDSNIETSIINYIKNEKSAGWVVSCDVAYNLMAIFWVRNSFTFNEFLKRFLEKFSKYIRERQIIMLTENHMQRKSYLFNKNLNLEDIYTGNEKEEELDEKDLKIIKILANNSIGKLYKIASSLKLTPEAVSHRIKVLQQKGILQAFRPTINSSLLGYQYYNVLFKLKRFEDIKALFDFFKEQKSIIYFVGYMGGYDIGVDIEVKNISELREFLQKTRDLFKNDIESYTSILIYQQHKLSYLPD